MTAEPSGRDALRVGTQEREDAIKVLGDHFAAGRLPMHEYEQRVDAAIDAQTVAEFRPLFTDLPAPLPEFLAPPAKAVAPAPVAPPPMLQPHAPHAPVIYSHKSRIAAGLLQIIFPFGTGRFYTGHTQMAVAQLLLVFVGVGVIWSLIDGVLLLLTGGTDGHGRPLRI